MTGPEAGLKPLPGRPRPPRSEDTETGDQGEQSAGHRARLTGTDQCLQKTGVMDVASRHRRGEKQQSGKILSPVNKTGDHPTFPVSTQQANVQKGRDTERWPLGLLSFLQIKFYWNSATAMHLDVPVAASASQPSHRNELHNKE